MMTKLLVQLSWRWSSSFAIQHNQEAPVSFSSSLAWYSARKTDRFKQKQKKMKPWTIATFETVFTDFFHKFVSISISTPLLQLNYKLVVFLWSELEPLNNWTNFSNGFWSKQVATWYFLSSKLYPVACKKVAKEYETKLERPTWQSTRNNNIGQ